jgi:hypothetical protein
LVLAAEALGAVTSNFEYRLHPIGPEVMFAFVFYHGDKSKDVLRFCQEFTATAPDDVSLLTVMGIILPGTEMFPDELHGAPFILLAACYAGDAEEGERVLQPLHQVDTPLIDFSGRMPYLEVQTVYDADYPAHQLRYYWKSIRLPGFYEERQHVYSLYPLLSHVCHFGGHYVAAVSEKLTRFGY